MVKQLANTKRLQIDKANATVVVLASVAAFIVTFSFFATKALLSQRAYQGRVIKEKNTAYHQLESNIKATDSLTTSYSNFVSQKINVIGGSKTGGGDSDGDNTKIILDALPSKYDFPALATSIEKLLKSGDFKLDSISGSDDELNQKATASSGLVEIPFNISVTGSYVGVNKALSLLERSIRPFQVDSLSFGGADAKITLSVKGRTFYQPEKSLKITTKEVK